VIALPAVAGDLPIRPDPKLTPGAVLTTDGAAVCQPGYSKSVRHLAVLRVSCVQPVLACHPPS